MTCAVVECLCRTRRHPEQLPAALHRTRKGGIADHVYRAAFGGTLANEMGTIAHSAFRIRRSK